MIQGNHVPALERAIAIFEYLEKIPGGAGLAEISSKLNIPKSSAYGILATLTRHGYLTSLDSNARYVLGTKFLSLAIAAERELDLVRLATPYLKELRDTTDETVKISVKNNRSAVVIARLEAEKEYHAGTKLGVHFPLHAGAAGKVLLAFSSRWERDKYFDSPLDVFTSATITARQDLERELSEIREKGYGEDRGETFEGILALGCPIFDHTGGTAAAISIAYLSTGNNERKKKEILDPLSAYAKKISAALGYTGK
jgi:DNA-binding IclR family transcriptional regulator